MLYRNIKASKDMETGITAYTIVDSTNTLSEVVHEAKLFAHAPAMFELLEKSERALVELYPSDIKHVDEAHHSEFEAMHGLIHKIQNILLKVNS